jgi:Holliday junction resolvase-like predicted endonuclease
VIYRLEFCQSVNSRQLGYWAETTVLEHLIDKGCVYLDSNYFGLHGELDLICLDVNTSEVIFIETKSCANAELLGLNITPQKLSKLQQTIARWLQAHPVYTQWRLDIALVHYQHANTLQLKSLQIFTLT